MGVSLSRVQEWRNEDHDSHVERELVPCGVISVGQWPLQFSLTPRHLSNPNPSSQFPTLNHPKLTQAQKAN